MKQEIQLEKEKRFIVWQKLTKHLQAIASK